MDSFFSHAHTITNTHAHILHVLTHGISGKILPSPTSSCLLLIFFTSPSLSPLHSSHAFYFSSLVFPSVGLNGLHQYIFRIKSLHSFFSPFSTSVPLCSPCILLSLIVDIVWKFQIASLFLQSRPHYLFICPFHRIAFSLSPFFSGFLCLFVDIVRLALIDHQQISAPSLHSLFPDPPPP